MTKILAVSVMSKFSKSTNLPSSQRTIKAKMEMTEMIFRDFFMIRSLGVCMSNLCINVQFDK